jgi:hypothetical protein
MQLAENENLFAPGQTKQFTCGNHLVQTLKRSVIELKQC